MKSGQYIWRTKQDSEVRPHHASREGKVFSWDDPPPGGHPGEEYNCRCWAEGKDCLRFRLELREIVKELMPLDSRLSEFGRQIHNTEGEIEELESRIKLFSIWKDARAVAETIARGTSVLAIVAQAFMR